MIGNSLKESYNKDLKFKVYLEVGNSCFCKCPMCNIHSKPHDRVSLKVVKRRVDRLVEGDVDTIRLAGNDPLTHPSIIEIIDYIESRGVKVDITSTMLSPSLTIIDRVSKVDTLRISISTLRYFKEFYGVDRLDLILKNFKRICKIRKSPFIINYTFVEKFKNWLIEDAESLKNLITNSPHFCGQVNFFPEIKYTSKWSLKDISDIENFISLLDFPHEFFGFELKKMSFCTVNKNHLYIDSTGNSYPCCMAGGEIGQDKLKELLVGNIDYDKVSEMRQVCIKDLDNYICNNCTPKFYSMMDK